MELKIDDIPSVRGLDVARGERVKRVSRLRPAWRRRTVLAGMATTAAATGLAALGILPPARGARADGYDILTSCPSYADPHNCSPGCGPSTIDFNACTYNSCTICTCDGWFKNDGVTYKLRPNQCLSGTGWDGWQWRYNASCGCCASSITYRCHDGYTKVSGSWVKRICRSTIGCGGCGC